ncbi:MAG TPA: hypothetical protein VFI03_07120 [Solirubrobacterales bacterium]|nr:hypothetical protein [Solirubrobacterales bacterium]
MSGYKTEPQGGSNGASGKSSRFDLPRIYVAGLIGIILIVILALDSLGDSDHSAARAPGVTGDAVSLTEYDLLSRAGTIEPSAYWIGRRPGTDHFELEIDPDGNVYVRYLAGQAAAGGSPSDSLTVATYPLAEARQRLEGAAQADGEKLLRRDGFVVLGSNDSNSAFVVFEDRPELQIEIYSPRQGEAWRLAGSGALTPLHWTPLA